MSELFYSQSSVTLLKFLEGIVATTNIDKLVKQSEFALLSIFPAELRAGDRESENSVPQAECIGQEPAELHHGQAAQWTLRRPSHSQAAQ